MLRYIPNIITCLRILLTLPIALLLIQDQYLPAIGLIVLAGLSDGLDGFLARRYNWQTPSGAILDPLADKTFLAALIVVLGVKQLIPLWLVLLVIARDLIILAGAGLYQWLTHDLTMQPLLVSKLNTALLVILVLTVTFSMLVVTVPDWLVQFMIWSVAITSIISGLAYIFIWTRYALRFKQGDK